MKKRIVELFERVDKGELTIGKHEDKFCIEEIKEDKIDILVSMCYATYSTYFRNLYKRKSCLFWTKAHSTERKLTNK